MLNEYFWINNTWCTVCSSYWQFITLRWMMFACVRVCVKFKIEMRLYVWVFVFGHNSNKSHNTIIILGAINFINYLWIYKSAQSDISIHRNAMENLFKFTVSTLEIQSVSIFSVVIVCVYVPFGLFFSLSLWFYTFGISEIQPNLNTNCKSVHIYQFPVWCWIKNTTQNCYTFVRGKKVRR